MEPPIRIELMTLSLREVAEKNSARHFGRIRESDCPPLPAGSTPGAHEPSTKFPGTQQQTDN